MNLETAHLVDLIQRNLQIAQTAIDTTHELFSQVIHLLGDVESPQQPLVKPRAHRVVRKASRQADDFKNQIHKQLKKTANGKRANGAKALVEEYLELHPNRDFSTNDIQVWITQHKGVDLKHEAIYQVLWALTKAEEVERIGKNLYKKAA